MKYHMSKKAIIGLGVVSLFLVIPLMMTAVPSQVVHPLSDVQLPHASISWDLESYYNYTGPLIDVDGYKQARVFINDSSPFYNWSAWSSYPWLIGSGTEEDPYVIEKLLIDSQGEGACLYIYHSNKSFIIRQCYFTNTGKEEFDIGMFFRYVENGEIYGNIISYAKTGFFLSFDCNNIAIYRNYMQATKTEGVLMRALYAGVGSHDCSFTQNVIFNYQQLMFVDNIANITIDGNFMNNTEYKEYLNPVISVLTTEKLKFRYNIFTDNYKWFDFGVSEVECANNTISGNSVINSLTGVEIPTPLCVRPFSIGISQGSSNIMSLGSTSNSQVINNYIYVEGAIPGFDPLIIIGIVGAMGVVLILIVIKKRTMRKNF
jgi:hypothetical protein